MRVKLKEKLVIQEATTKDIPLILSCENMTDRFKMSKFSEEIDKDELLFWVKDQRSLVIVAKLSSELVGYAYGFMLSPKWFFFDTFYVVSKFQNIGIGKRMYNYLRDICNEREIQLIQGLIKDTKKNSLDYWMNRGFEFGCKCIWVEDWLDE